MNVYYTCSCCRCSLFSSFWLLCIVLVCLIYSDASYSIRWCRRSFLNHFIINTWRSIFFFFFTWREGSEKLSFAFEGQWSRSIRVKKVQVAHNFHGHCTSHDWVLVCSRDHFHSYRPLVLHNFLLFTPLALKKSCCWMCLIFIRCFLSADHFWWSSLIKQKDW